MSTVLPGGVSHDDRPRVQAARQLYDHASQGELQSLYGMHTP